MLYSALIDGGKIPAGGYDSGRGFLVKIWSPVRLAEVMKLFENEEKIVILLVVKFFKLLFITLPENLKNSNSQSSETLIF